MSCVLPEFYPVRELHLLPAIEGFPQIAVTPGVNLPLDRKKVSSLKQQAGLNGAAMAPGHSRCLHSAGPCESACSVWPSS